jgi:DNA replication and repair protein RecF
VILVSLVITDFRNITDLTIEPDATGTTVITGRNGAGKTSVLEAVTYLSTLQSFRGSPREAMVRRGAERSILRAETLVEGRAVIIEAEISATGRSRTMVNRQNVRRRGDLHEALRTTIFSPEDIGVVRAGPAERRHFLDETLAVVDPKASRAAEEVEKILRQRAALLRNSGRRLTPEVGATLDVWDSRLDVAGTALVEAREQLVVELGPIAESHYSRLAGAPTEIGLVYMRSWTGRLADALVECRSKDGGSLRSDHTATSSSSPSAACPAGPTPPRGSSAHWPWPCSWPPISWPPSVWDRHRCSSSMMCSPNSTHTGPGPC